MSKNSREDDILLYVKHWYFDSSDKVRDLKIIFGYHNACEPNINDMFEMVSTMFFNYLIKDAKEHSHNSSHLFRECLAGSFPRTMPHGFRAKVSTHWDMLNSMLILLAIHVNKDQMNSTEIDSELQELLIAEYDKGEGE